MSLIGKKYRLKNNFNYKNPDESGIVHGRDLNELIDELTDGTSTDLSVDTITVETLTSNTAITSPALTTSGAIRTTSSSQPIGYNTGAGGIVTQLTSLSTSVTLNKTSGVITTVSATLAAGVDDTFTVLNSSVAATDVVVACIANYAGTADGIPTVYVTDIAEGGFDLTIRNTGAVALDSTIDINFIVLKGTNA
jgi:hypothetical protein